MSFIICKEKRKPFSASKAVGALVVFCMILSCAGADAAAAKSRKRGGNDRYASIVIDADTGAVLSERYADKQLYPASLTKMMTLYLTFEALESGALRRSQVLPVSAHAARQEPSSLGLKPGSGLRVSDAVFALVTKSANDAAVVLAEAIGGTESRFADRMTQRARALGMRNTQFRNASGLFHPGQVSTARDMARLSQALIHHYPGYYKYFSTSQFTYAGRTHGNHNKLMKSYTGMDGIKTGYVRQSGFNLAASAVRDGRRLVGVVFGGRTTHTRNAHMAALLDAGFASAADGDLRIASAAPLPQKKPRFDAMGLVMRDTLVEEASYAPVEQGDTSDENAAARPFSSAFRPGSDNAPVGAGTAAAAARDWAVQVGAFTTREAGMRALQQARGRLPHDTATAAGFVLAPLATNRGTIYRARLSGMDRETAGGACRVLKGSCLVLSTR